MILVSAEFVSYICTILSKQNILLFRRRILPRKKYLKKDFQVRYRKLKQAKGSSTYYLILINNSDCEQKPVILISWKNINLSISFLACAAIFRYIVSRSFNTFNRHLKISRHYESPGCTQIYSRRLPALRRKLRI